MTRTRAFRDRRDAGVQVADLVVATAPRDPVVLGIPRGGVVVAAVVADVLGAALDVVPVRKVGLPAQPEIAMGAVGEDGTAAVNDDIVRAARVGPDVVASATARERTELDRRAARYRRGRGPLSLRGRTVVVVDDGVATGATARVALDRVRELGAARVVLAVPVGPPSTLRDLERHADAVLCVLRPAEFHAVGCVYDDFDPPTDDEVAAALARRQRESSATTG